MAAPAVSGAAALLKSYWPSLNSSEVAAILLATARDLGAPGTDAVYGGHSHVGTMIYLGDNWPEIYRDRIFTHNLHLPRSFFLFACCSTGSSWSSSSCLKRKKILSRSSRLSTHLNIPNVARPRDIAVAPGHPRTHLWPSLKVPHDHRGDKGSQECSISFTAFGVFMAEKPLPVHPASLPECIFGTGDAN
jgi:hypothetical protein